MPLFMDVHQTLPDGVTADALFDAHKADLATQGKYGVKYINFWGDPEGGKAFCLVEAPDPETATRCTARRTGSWPTRSTRSSRAERAKGGGPRDGAAALFSC